MSGIVTREIKAPDLSPEELQQVADLMTAMGQEIDPSEPATTTAWARSELHSGMKVRRYRRLIALLNDVIVGLGNIELLEDDANKHLIDLNIEVHPDHRRVGVGRALLDHGLQIAREVDRPSLLSWGTKSEATDSFWESVGLREKQIERMSRLRLDEVDRDLMERWHTESSARAEGYTIHSWEGRCPDELMAAFVAAYRGMYDAPMDGLDLEFPPITEESIRQGEESHRQRGMIEKVVLALDPNGEPAAVTEIALLRDREWFAWQQGTTTLDAHRNQGLGRWVKAEMAVRVLDDHPEVRVIETGNADSNAPMLAINTEMGFRPHLDLTVRQAPVTDVVAALEARRASRG